VAGPFSRYYCLQLVRVVDDASKAEEQKDADSAFIRVEYSLIMLPKQRFGGMIRMDFGC